MKKTVKIMITILLCAVMFTGCSAAPNTGGNSEPPKKAANQDKYAGRYNLVSIEGDKSIKDNYKFYYINLEEGGYFYQKAEPVKEKGVKIDNYGKYVIMEGGEIELIYNGLENYIQKAEISDNNLLYVDTVDGYRYVYEKVK